MGLLIVPIFLIAGLIFSFGLSYTAAWKSQFFKAYQAWKVQKEFEFRQVEFHHLMNPFALFNLFLPLPSRSRIPDFYETIPDWATHGLSQSKKLALYGILGMVGGIILLFIFLYFNLM